MNLDVLFNDAVDVEGVLVSVDFTPQGSHTPTLLYKQDFKPQTPGPYSPGDEFTDQVSWLIPSFAPLGHYAVSIKVHGPDQEADVWACLTADFDIYEQTE